MALKNLALRVESHCVYLSVVPAGKHQSWGSLLLTLPHKGKGWGGSLDPQLGIQPFLSAICVQFCPKHTWRWESQRGARAYRLKKNWLRGALSFGYGEVIIHDGCGLSRADALAPPVPLPITPQPCSISNPNTLIGSQGWTSADSNLDLSLGPCEEEQHPRLTSSLHAHMQKEHFLGRWLLPIKYGQWSKTQPYSVFKKVHKDFFILIVLVNSSYLCIYLFT